MSYFPPEDCDDWSILPPAEERIPSGLRKVAQKAAREIDAHKIFWYTDVYPPYFPTSWRFSFDEHAATGATEPSFIEIVPDFLQEGA